MCNAGSEYSSRERRAVSQRRLPRTRTPAPAHPTHDAAAEHNVYSLSTAGFGCPICGAVTFYHILDEQSRPICVKSRMTTEKNGEKDELDQNDRCCSRLLALQHS